MVAAKSPKNATAPRVHPRGLRHYRPKSPQAGILPDVEFQDQGFGTAVGK